MTKFSEEFQNDVVDFWNENKGKVKGKEVTGVHMKRMTEKVDKQNEGDRKYIPMKNNPNSLSFQAACKLVLEGAEQPSGYTEPILHQMRIAAKNKYNL